MHPTRDHLAHEPDAPITRMDTASRLVILSVSQCGAVRPQLDDAASHCSGVGMKLAFGTTGLDGGPSRSDGQQTLHALRIIRVA